MKRIVALVFAALLMLCACACAAEIVEAAEAGATGTLPTEPFTWKALGTIAGCTAFALLFVQLIKAPLDNVWKIPTRALVYIVCLILMLASAAFNGGLTLESAALAVVNAVIPTLAAMGAYEMTFGRDE
jgi:hypothetical protein